MGVAKLLTIKLRKYLHGTFLDVFGNLCHIPGCVWEPLSHCSVWFHCIFPIFQQATRYRLEMQAKVSQYKATISDLRKRLNFTRQSVSQRDSTLERFQTKLSRLRIALTTEIDRVSYSYISYNAKFVVS